MDCSREAARLPSPSRVVLVSMAAARLHFAAHGLDKKDRFGKSDPYIVLSRGGDGDEAQTVWRSPVVMKTLDPTWEAVVVPFAALFGSAAPTEDDWEAPLELRVWDWDRVGGDDFIGMVRLTADWMRQNVGGTLPLTNPVELTKAERRGKTYGNSGVVHLLAFDVVGLVAPSDEPAAPRGKPAAPAHPPPRGEGARLGKTPPQEEAASQSSGSRPVEARSALTTTTTTTTTTREAVRDEGWGTEEAKDDRYVDDLRCGI